jgi:phosphoribosylanthranilate isomerase
MIEIKICGLRREEDIAAANVLLPDFAGFVFAKSSRQVEPLEAQALIRGLSKKVGAVGVFVGAQPVEAAKTARLCSLRAVQLHGGENGEYISILRSLLPNGCEIWSAARVRCLDDIKAAAERKADRLLLDAFSETAPGGTGMTFNWEILKDADIDRPFFVAGGINAGNVKQAIEKAKTKGIPFGIDVSGGVETDGFKDFDKMEQIISIVRNN